MKGDIRLGDKDILRGVEVDVRDESRESGNWQGIFTIDDPSELIMGEEYLLKLADGRTGRILISGMSSSSRSGTIGTTIVKFTGTGPLN